MSNAEATGVPKEEHYKRLFVKKHQYRRRQAEQEESKEYLDLISFSLLNETYGIPLKHLKEIMKAENIERIPQSPRHLLGILNIRGNLVTVMNLKERLGFAPTEIQNDSRIIIVEHDQRPIGLLVDQVNAIIRLEKQTLVEPPKGIDEERRKFIEGIGKMGGQEIILPNLTEILTLP